eukprot:TRINITY_DN4710_c0_g1_i8.p2 TRINITY_DN4710_c0_g1~~TRINITY_DN4710_c0_g1_i8.p2  ORF type:complete len:143 (-),score=30.15 TRINITY_DN4710_c0_g1_i8:436-864(-)
MAFCLFFYNVFLVQFFFFFFSSRRRHTRCREVSWARRCVQETARMLTSTRKIRAETPQVSPPLDNKSTRPKKYQVSTYAQRKTLVNLLISTDLTLAQVSAKLFNNIGCQSLWAQIYNSQEYISRVSNRRKNQEKRKRSQRMH